MLGAHDNIAEYVLVRGHQYFSAIYEYSCEKRADDSIPKRDASMSRKRI